MGVSGTSNGRQERSPYILVAERDEGVRETIVELLEDRGTRCATAANADEAILSLRHDVFDAIVADLTLFASRRSGLLCAVCSHRPVPGILLTHAGAGGSSEEEADGFRMIRKPFLSTTFLRALEQVLQRSGDTV